MEFISDDSLLISAKLRAGDAETVEEIVMEMPTRPRVIGIHDKGSFELGILT